MSTRLGGRRAGVARIAGGPPAVFAHNRLVVVIPAANPGTEQPLLIKLKPGKNGIRLTNLNGRGINVNYLAVTSPDVKVTRDVLVQIGAVATTLVYSGVGSFIILKIIDMVIGLRVSEEEEREGLDVSLHGERVE